MHLYGCGGMPKRKEKSIVGCLDVDDAVTVMRTGEPENCFV
jgi:hypothetical protein